MWAWNRVASLFWLFELRVAARSVYYLHMGQAHKTNGSAIRQHRKAAKVTQRDLAQAAGISASHLHRVEVGERDTSIRVIEAISSTLGIDADAITTEQVAA